jgi:hypothetical protein
VHRACLSGCFELALASDYVVAASCAKIGSVRSGCIHWFTAHSAFEDPTAPADVLPRESIELRTLVFKG